MQKYIYIYYNCKTLSLDRNGRGIFYATYQCMENKANVIYEPVHEICNNVVCATSKASDQPAHTRSLIRAFAGPLSIL